MNANAHLQTSDPNEPDKGLVFDYRGDYHSLEAALVRAGFTRAGRSIGSARPD